MTTAQNNTSTSANTHQGGLVPRLRFPEFEGEWAPVLASQIFSQISNKNHKSDIPILAITQEHGAIPRDEIDYNVSVTEKSIDSYKVVEIGDFIISLRSFQGGIEYSKYHGICNPAYVILRLTAHQSSSYFRHLLKTARFISDMTKNIEGLRDGKMVSYKQFSELRLPTPTLPEQQKIADCLSSLDELIAAEDQKLATLKVHKKGLMQELFPREGESVPQIRFPEFEGAGEWSWAELASVCEILNNRRRPVTQSDRNAGPYPYYGASGIVDYIDDFIFDEKLILVGEDGAKWGAFENTAFLADGKYWVNNHAHVLRPTSINDVILSNYLIMIDFSPFVTGAAPPKLTLGNLKAIRIPVPPNADEQQKIAAVLSSLDDRISAQAERIEALRVHKKGLMQGLFPVMEG